jgi:predicted nuclease of predicted toxin-antitoxin system
MRWLGDECLSASLVNLLRAEGHDVLYVAEMAAGLSDTEVIRLALQEDRLLLTEDKDFGELVVRFGYSVPGLVLIRIDPAKPTLRARRLGAAIQQFGERLFGRYLVIEDARLRARKLQAPSRFER